jgi:hypothetical protein
MILLVLAAAVAPVGDTPRHFIERVYAHYRDENYSPFVHPERVFAPPLTAAIREDERLAKGEVGYLDGDPLCDCQDYEKLTARIRKLDRPTRQSAGALVHLDYGNGEGRDLRLKLVLTKSGWRVADVGSTDQPSLLGALQRSNAAARTSHRR